MARSFTWMIYGATGYTGTLIAEAAVSRGHQPVLAGRSRDKVAALAKRLGLKYVVFDLSDINTIAGAIADMDIVLNAAGPFIHTGDPMIRACLATKTHYLDIAGEVPALENLFSYHDTALKNGMALIGGVGFDVVPTDCLALYVAQQVKTAHWLEIAFKGLDSTSSGTTKSVIEGAPGGGFIRRDGALQPYPPGKGGKHIRFSNGEFYAMPIPRGDLATAYRTTGCPNITAYKAIPRSLALAVRLTFPLVQRAMQSPFLIRLTTRLAERFISGPDAATRETERAYIRARAANKEGTVSVEAWLEVVEPYRFTAESSVRAVEQTAEFHPVGAITSALAFGADFVLDVPGTVRMDKLSG